MKTSKAKTGKPDTRVTLDDGRTVTVVTIDTPEKLRELFSGKGVAR